MPISLGFWELGCPYHCDSALLFAIGKALDAKLNVFVKEIQNCNGIELVLSDIGLVVLMEVSTFAVDSVYLFCLIPRSL